MKHCNYCGKEVNDNMRYCNYCGKEMVNDLNKKLSLNKDVDNPNDFDRGTFIHMGIEVDLNELMERNKGKKINAVKELRDITGLGLREAKEVIDNHHRIDNKQIKKNSSNNKNDNQDAIAGFMVIILIVALSMIKLPDMSFIDFMVLSTYSIFGIVISSILILILKIRRKENKFVKLAFKLSLIVFISSFIMEIFGPKPIMFFVGMYLIFKYDKLIKEEKLRREQKVKKEKEEEELRKEQKEKELLDLIFEKNDIKTKLKSFIIENTKMYDEDTMGISQYMDKVDDFLEYINIVIGDDLNVNDVSRDSLKVYIDSKKESYYTDDMDSILKIEDYTNLNNIAKIYLNIYGDNGLKEVNLKILSKLLEEDIKDIEEAVNLEYEKIKKEYRKKRLEKGLFSTNKINIEDIDKLSGFQFEDFLNELLTSFGYKNEELPYSNDFGADLIIDKGFNRIVIQAKNYTSGNVTNKAVQEVVSAKAHYKCDTSMVITNSYYTQSAMKTAESNNVILVDRDKLIKILDEGAMYFNSLV